MRYRTALLVLTTAILCYLGFQGLEGGSSDIAQLLFVISLILLAIDLARSLLRSQDRRGLKKAESGKDGDNQGADNSHRGGGA